MSEITSTPFSQWSQKGEADPHGLHYQGDDAKIAMKDKPCRVVAELFPAMVGTLMGIAWLTTAKERLRWLSRKLYRLSDEHVGLNERRAQTPRGELTDDELANAFFMSESKDDMAAGKARILWLLSEIKALDAPKQFAKQ